MDNNNKMIKDTPREKELETRDELFLAEVKDKRVAVLLSGGVDSSVVVWEFARLGLNPDCFYIKIGPEERRNGTALLRRTWRWLPPWLTDTDASCR